MLVCMSFFIDYIHVVFDIVNVLVVIAIYSVESILERLHIDNETAKFKPYMFLYVICSIYVFLLCFFFFFLSYDVIKLTTYN